MDTMYAMMEIKSVEMVAVQLAPLNQDGSALEEICIHLTFAMNCVEMVLYIQKALMFCIFRNHARKS
jgi:hypothetical protein